MLKEQNDGIVVLLCPLPKAGERSLNLLTWSAGIRTFLSLASLSATLTEVCYRHETCGCKADRGSQV